MVNQDTRKERPPDRNRLLLSSAIRRLGPNDDGYLLSSRFKGERLAYDLSGATYAGRGGFGVGLRVPVGRLTRRGRFEAGAKYPNQVDEEDTYFVFLKVALPGYGGTLLIENNAFDKIERVNAERAKNKRANGEEEPLGPLEIVTRYDHKNDMVSGFIVEELLEEVPLVPHPNMLPIYLELFVDGIFSLADINCYFFLRDHSLGNASMVRVQGSGQRGKPYSEEELMHHLRRGQGKRVYIDPAQLLARATGRNSTKVGVRDIGGDPMYSSPHSLWHVIKPDDGLPGDVSSATEIYGQGVVLGEQIHGMPYKGFKVRVGSEEVVITDKRQFVGADNLEEIVRPIKTAELEHDGTIAFPFKHIRRPAIRTADPTLAAAAGEIVIECVNLQKPPGYESLMRSLLTNKQLGLQPSTRGNPRTRVMFRVTKATPMGLVGEKTHRPTARLFERVGTARRGRSGVRESGVRESGVRRPEASGRSRVQGSGMRGSGVHEGRVTKQERGGHGRMHGGGARRSQEGGVREQGGDRSDRQRDVWGDVGRRG